MSGATAAAADYLATPEAVRERAARLLALAEAGRLDHFAYRPERLEPAVDYVVATIRANYPDLAIPFHSRWRHFGVGGVDRWRGLARRIGEGDAAERARIRFDLAVTSVLLDAGAGAAWCYRDARGGRYGRSEGLGVASFEMFAAGRFSAVPAEPWRADAATLCGLDAAALAAGMQVSPENPLVGLEGRAALLRRLGAALEAAPELFGRPGRVGNLFDYLRAQAQAEAGRLPARAILIALLRGLGAIWPGRHRLAGVALGDAWPHPALDDGTPGSAFVPFHKLSQWLAYSLIEPLEEAGIAVVEVDALTGLAEYRNGGFIIDSGLVVPRNPALPEQPLAVDDVAVVEWRGLTVALLDRLARGVRARLGRDAATLPLARVLEGGTWAAGRRIAAALRPGGGPPLAILSDGTVF